MRNEKTTENLICDRFAGDVSAFRRFVAQGWGKDALSDLPGPPATLREVASAAESLAERHGWMPEFRTRIETLGPTDVLWYGAHSLVPFIGVALLIAFLAFELSMSVWVIVVAAAAAVAVVSLRRWVAPEREPRSFRLGALASMLLILSFGGDFVSVSEEAGHRGSGDAPSTREARGGITWPWPGPDISFPSDLLHSTTEESDEFDIVGRGVALFRGGLEGNELLFSPVVTLPAVEDVVFDYPPYEFRADTSTGMSIECGKESGATCSATLTDCRFDGTRQAPGHPQARCSTDAVKWGDITRTSVVGRVVVAPEGSTGELRGNPDLLGWAREVVEVPTSRRRKACREAFWEYRVSNFGVGAVAVYPYGSVSPPDLIGRADPPSLPVSPKYVLSSSTRSTRPVVERGLREWFVLRPGEGADISAWGSTCSREWESRFWVVDRVGLHHAHYGFSVDHPAGAYPAYAGHATRHRILR